MFDKLGIAGVLGVLIMMGGIALLAWYSLYVAAGVAFVVAGVGLITYGMVTSLLSSLGMGGMV